MAEVDRSVFNKRIGEIAVDLGLLSPQDQQQMHVVQARAYAIIERGGDLPAIPELANDQYWARVQSVLGISDAAMTKAYTDVTGPNPITLPGVPPAGDILSKLNLIDPVVKDALLAAQASEKALAALERAKQSGQGFDQSNFDARLNEIDQLPDFAHLGRDGEYPLAANAQRVHKTSLQFEALEHHVDCNSNNEQDPEFAQLRQMLATTLPQQVATTYRSAALALGLRAEQLAQQNNPHAVQTGAAADALINTLANQLNIAPPTAEELDQLRGTQTSQHTADAIAHTATTATELNQTSKSFVDSEHAKRDGQAPQSGVTV